MVFHSKDTSGSRLSEGDTEIYSYVAGNAETTGDTPVYTYVYTYVWRHLLVQLHISGVHVHVSKKLRSLRKALAFTSTCSFYILCLLINFLCTQPPSGGTGVGVGAPLSSENGNIGNLINDAMEDIIAPTNAPPKATPTSYTKSQPRKKPSNKVTSAQSKSKMEIHVSDDNSVVMDFNSDSENDDDDDNILRDLMSHHRRRQNPSNGSRARERKRGDEPGPSGGKSMKQSGSDYGSIFSESDDDFCFVDAPTITKVVSVLCHGSNNIIIVCNVSVKQVMILVSSLIIVCSVYPIA